MTDAKEAMQKRSYSMADAVTIGREQTILFAMDASDQAEQAVECMFLRINENFTVKSASKSNSLLQAKSITPFDFNLKGGFRPLLSSFIESN